MTVETRSGRVEYTIKTHSFSLRRDRGSLLVRTPLPTPTVPNFLMYNPCRK